MNCCRFAASLLAVVLACISTSTPGSEVDRDLVRAMQSNPRGPFASVQWFCGDGTVLPPKPYACKDHGGGHQHGALSADALELRAQGYKIANLLAGIDPAAVLDEPDAVDTVAQILVERYLIAAQGGWIFRRALFYRGAIQEEDERAGGEALLLELAGRDDWIATRYPMVWSAVGALPHGAATGSAQRIRQESASLADRDAGFQPLRAKIHGSPDPTDAARVRQYAAQVDDPDLMAAYRSLADAIDEVYAAVPLAELLRSAARQRAFSGRLGTALEKFARDLAADGSVEREFAVSARVLAAFRDELPGLGGAQARLAALDLGQQVEAAHFRAGAALIGNIEGASRGRRVDFLEQSIEAAYGVGLLRPRERAALAESLDRLHGDTVTLGTYREDLGYLARVAAWTAQNLRFHFGLSVAKLTEIEPRAELFLQDRLRGSPAFAYAHIIDALLVDAQALAGAEHRLFDRTVGTGLRMLNPGLARGVLVADADMGDLEGFRPDGIYLLPETVSELPPVAGILTAGGGNPLSHVQLLARNLGIPNVAVDVALLDRIRAASGRHVVLAVSPGGRVELVPDAPAFDPYFANARTDAVVIRPDLKKLDLDRREFVSLDDLTAQDSGRIVGPKAAKLGELRRAFPQHVARGVAIPFGLFRAAVLDRPYGSSGLTFFDWIVREYRRIEALPADAPPRVAESERLRASIYATIAGTDPGPGFREGLRGAMQRVFGSTSLGVFVRSDTNVEDLPGFTGAGLNLTLPNVVGFDNIVQAVSEVWASPYTERAFAWRNAHMESPEHVYPAVLLLETVAADKSGVLITADVATGDRRYLSVAVNEGVGGAVAGQAAESVCIDRKNGAIRLLSSASAPTRSVPSPRGGLDELPTSGADQLLMPGEARALIGFAQQLPNRFPPITDAEDQPAPADVEFGFVNGVLELLQIRPFLESRSARESVYLARLDAADADSESKRVDMNGKPVQ